MEEEMRRIATVALVLLAAPALLGAGNPRLGSRKDAGGGDLVLRPGFDSMAKEKIHPERIADDLPTGKWWTPTGIDFTGATVWYMDPSQTGSGHAGTLADPWPNLHYCRTTYGYIRQFNSSGEQTQAGSVAPGDVVVLMRGDHGGVQLDYQFYPEWTAFVGMKGAYIDSLDVMGWSNIIFENLEFRRLRSDFLKTYNTPTVFHGDTDVESTTGLLDDFTVAPALVHMTRHSGEQPHNAIFNHCKFWPGENHRRWTRDEWNTKAVKGVYFDHSTNVLVCNSTFYGTACAMTSSGQQYASFYNNVVYGHNGDVTQTWGINGDGTFRRQTAYWACVGNKIFDTYVTNVDHIDALGVVDSDWPDTCRMRWIAFDDNLVVATTDKNRNSDIEPTEANPNPGHFYVWSDDDYSVVDGGTTYTNDWGPCEIGLGSPAYERTSSYPIAHWTATNNVIITPGYLGIYARTSCDSCEFVNNTVIPMFDYADIPHGDDSTLPTGAGSVYFQKGDSTAVYPDRNHYKDCIVANNVKGSAWYETDHFGVKYIDNYVTAYDSATVGLTAYNRDTNWAAWNLTPAAGSPLIDAASSTYAPAKDYNGASRPIGLYDDIGAREAPDHKYYCTFTIASGDSSDNHISAGLSGTTAVNACTFEYQDKLKGGTFAPAGSAEIVSGAIAFTYTTDFLVTSLTAEVDSLYVRGRITSGSHTGPWHEEVVYRARQPYYVIYVFAETGTSGITAAGDSVRIDYGPELTWNNHKTYKGARVNWLKTTMYRGAFSVEKEMEADATFCTASLLNMTLDAGAPFAAGAGKTDAAGLLYFGVDVVDSLAGGTVADADLYVFYGANTPAGTAYYVACTAAGMYQWATGNADVSHTNAKQSTTTAWTTALGTYANWAAFGPSTSVAGYAAASSRTRVPFTTPTQSWDGAASYAGCLLIGGTHTSTDPAYMSHFGDSDADRRPILVVKVIK